MRSIDPTCLASMTLSIHWQDGGIHHTDCRHVPEVNFYRDIFAPDIYQALMGRQAGDKLRFEIAPGQVPALPDPAKIWHLDHGRRNQDLLGGNPLRYGRFYPQGLLKGLPGVFMGNTVPFRCLAVDDRGFCADGNHPMAGRPFSLEIEIHQVDPKNRERGGPSTDWVEAALEGPGMQARANGKPTAFWDDAPFARQDETGDPLFYAGPRLVNHIDETAITVIEGLYGRLLKPHMQVLDLMSSWTSHLPADLTPLCVTGLGLNADELKANARLNRSLVHDLNADPVLPFASASFDAIVCSLSVEYLIHPLVVFSEAARVLKPGGVFVVTFSTRWFPPKAIRIWSEIHPFERMGLVLELFLLSNGFADPNTYSLQGLPRPEQDKYSMQQRFSDPVFAVWSHRR